MRLPLLLFLLLPFPLAGCVGVMVERSRDGTPRPVVDARRLEPGRTTLRETLERLGPPDLLLRVGEVDRAYYVSWDSDYAKLVVSATLPFRNFSWDVFILSIGSEELRMARLDFGRGGVLRDLQAVDIETHNHGESFALDNRIVERFLEDRARALGLSESDDDDEDLEAPPKK
ncbi:MAG TPA: hypothetical protein VJB14_10830 [Planctomycetota bacterium]|nr:hypothetical protein [Planctomycetota bacterium]